MMTYIGTISNKRRKQMPVYVQYSESKCSLTYTLPTFDAKGFISLAGLLRYVRDVQGDDNVTFTAWHP